MGIASRKTELFVDLGSNPRAQPPPPAGERQGLVGFLG
jgi:hypothetical protein